MQLDDIIIQIGRQGFSLLDVLLFGAGLALVLLLMAVILAFRAQRGRKAEMQDALQHAADMEYRLAEMAGSLRSFAEQTQGQQAHMAQALNERLDQVGHRVGAGLNDQAARTQHALSQLHERLAVIDTAQRNITTLSTEMVSLKDILANKQTRGAFGQGRMEAIIRDGLQSTAFSFQATLSNGMRPDCVIHLPDSVLKLVIDAKFPLEAYNALRGCQSEAEAKVAETRLRADVLRHVKDISDKYFISGETQETAIMFVPSESISAELHEKFEDVIQKAHKLRVIIASPNVLLLLVQTMQALFKDVAMREQAHAIKNEVSKLLEDVTRLTDRVGDLKKHFELANTDIEKLGISSDRIAKRGLRIESLDLEDVPTLDDAAQAPRLVGTRKIS